MNGALPFLVDADYVTFFDEDNEMDPDHLRLLAKAVVGAGVDWGFSLRRIIDASGNDVCPDNCESLGSLCHTVCAPTDRLIDTSCYLIARDLAIRASPAWNHRHRADDGIEADRELCRVLLGVPHACSRRHSLRYRAGSADTSVTADFFARGNERFGYDFAAHPDLYVFHFAPEVTAAYLATRRRTDRSYALDEWQMTLLRGLDASRGASRGASRDGAGQRYNLLDGYACAPHIPRGATCLVTMCMPEDVPWKFLESRPDLRRIAYTLESPNIRHAAQWDPVRLAKHFDCVMTVRLPGRSARGRWPLGSGKKSWAPKIARHQKRWTGLRGSVSDRGRAASEAASVPPSQYWRALLDDPRVPTVFCAHNTHHLDLDDPVDRGVLRTNRGTGRSCAMVLERRDLRGCYKVPNTDVALRCLDPLREAFVKDLNEVTVFGTGWDAAAARNPGITVGHTMHRSEDPRTAVDILENYTFALIVENCDAEGYASEKLYDALIAGAIPLYYGSVPAEVYVPEGPDTGVYKDLKPLVGPPEAVAPDASARIRAFLDGLDDDTVAAWKARVEALREGVLRQVDVASFAGAARRAMSVCE